MMMILQIELVGDFFYFLFILKILFYKRVSSGCDKRNVIGTLKERKENNIMVIRILVSF